MADGEIKTDPTWTPPHRSGKPVRARQMKVDHPEMTTAEIAAKCGMTPRAVWSALNVLTRPRRSPAYRGRTSEPHAVIVNISPSPRHSTAHEKTVARNPTHPEHTHRSLPLTRAECPTQRPCMYLSCRHHMGNDQGEKGVQVMDLPLDTVPTCSLDIADGGAKTLEEVAVLMGVTREYVRQIETKALRQIRINGGLALAALSEYHADGPSERRGIWDGLEDSIKPGGHVRVKQGMQ
jgi:hypothetical protein